VKRQGQPGETVLAPQAVHIQRAVVEAQVPPCFTLLPRSCQGLLVTP